MNVSYDLLSVSVDAGIAHLRLNRPSKRNAINNTLVVLEIFHLLGYRKKRIENGKLIVTKRRYDLHGPEADAGRD